jgi:hypothetical protein
MAQWTMTDGAAGSPLWANNQLNVTKNKTELYLNVTAENVIANVAVGVFGVDTSEMANTSSESDKVTHAGWVLRTEGTGGRSGRVQYETLVAAGSMTGDGADDTQLPD